MTPFSPINPVRCCRHSKCHEQLRQELKDTRESVTALFSEMLRLKDEVARLRARDNDFDKLASRIVKKSKPVTPKSADFMPLSPLLGELQHFESDKTNQYYVDRYINNN